MKTLKNWKTFNELNINTYNSAAKLATKYGRNKLADDLKKHIPVVTRTRNFGYINKDIEPFTFVDSTKIDINLSFVEFDDGSSIMEYNESDFEYIQISMSFVDEHGDFHNMYISVDRVTMIDDEGEEENLRMKNRKDVNRIKKLISDNLPNIIKEIDIDIKEDKMTEENKQSYIKDYEEIVKLPAHLFLQ